ncbi:thiamine phosphate synthase [Flammeovirga yaeyamensis]|uniref:Thiamine-phosphate synthase n=1 Tax=Flammeovirga yaeyamensis TaxID=367791 RepID=A0AAX1N4P8_9BACT|nr:thiamine phosphate synthase [Flammeovirga yaeyamensis]MBB3701452.1 thiamine-phosphate pyrophosphorylase [Flammeovirga yaeyamensis]NMF38516.1 thiamine phosphate synthase [Flammeovirga yaeyamensis]QWG02404.1 thiamine phosphate synthase [Flammeovirga yaeyamensis]
MISKLHYISTEKKDKNHLQHIKEACEAGCRWIQLRAKEVTEEEYIALGIEAKKITDQYNAVLLINDKPEVAKAIGADGVHVGKEDISPATAREILGENKIVGGTANTIEDIQRLYDFGVDYIGLGPFRFTQTKKKLSPILGLDGYQSLLDECKNRGIDTPIIAIGGIETADVKSILSTGIYGVAVSGLIANAPQPEKVVSELEVELAL